MGGWTSREWADDGDALDVSPWPGEATQLRYAVDAFMWRPTAAEWELLLELLPPCEIAEVEKFTSSMDRKRAMISRLLQRRCVCEALGVMYADVVIERTRGGKPFEASAAPRPAAVANFNFNVSHEGHLVILASEPMLLVGVDVSAPFELRGGPPMGDFNALRDIFGPSFTDDEWEAMGAAGSEAARVTSFRRQWSLKEAFVKARGDGLAFELRRVEFCSCRPPREPPVTGTDAPSRRSEDMIGEESTQLRSDADSGARHCDERVAEFAGRYGCSVGSGLAGWSRVYLDGELREDWWGHVVELPRGHIVSVVRAPVGEAQDSYGAFRSTFGRTDIDDGELRSRFATPTPPFRLLSVRDLVPNDLCESYDFTRRDPSPAAVLARGSGRKADHRATPPRPEWLNEANLSSVNEFAGGMNDCATM